MSASTKHQCLFQMSQARTYCTRMPHQGQSSKLGPPVDLDVSAGPRPLERTPTTTSIASFDAPAIPITNKPTNLVTTPVTPSTLYVEKPSTLYVKEPSTRNVKPYSDACYGIDLDPPLTTPMTVLSYPALYTLKNLLRRPLWRRSLLAIPITALSYPDTSIQGLNLDISE